MVNGEDRTCKQLLRRNPNRALSHDGEPCQFVSGQARVDRRTLCPASRIFGSTFAVAIVSHSSTPCSPDFLWPNSSSSHVPSNGIGCPVSLPTCNKDLQPFCPRVRDQRVLVPLGRQTQICTLFPIDSTGPCSRGRLTTYLMTVRGKERSKNPSTFVYPHPLNARLTDSL
ncbi:hypothetical protein H4582DRAFT_1525743 [Lactarius indigo]|nr:hypothetical protein H4582DRAFT_1525743 [Lactarius indigo]